MKSEKILIIGKLAYLKLFDERGYLENPNMQYVDGSDYKKIFWRFYFREY